jgi:hypothetical protein
MTGVCRRTLCITDVYERVIRVLTVYALKSSIKYIKTGTVCIAFPRISRNGQIGKIWCFPEIPGIPRKSPENPTKTPRENSGFFRVLRL